MPRKVSEKVTCRTPTPGKQPTNIDRWKFDLIRKAILDVIPKRGEGIAFSELPRRVKSQLTPRQRDELGSLSWYVTVVKLELEVRGELARVNGTGPQRLLKQ